MVKLFAIIMGLVVFGGWMSIVGNPHVVETLIGLALFLGAGGFTYYQLNKVATKFKKT